jgi:predicted RNA-binding protein YlqC (UPF0109 family)
MEKDQAFLEYVVKALVDKEDAVEITRTVDNLGVLLTLTVDPSDMGKVIGKEGNIALALRKILHVVGMKNNSRVNLRINEPAGGKASAYPSGVKGSVQQRAPRTLDEVVDELR